MEAATAPGEPKVSPASLTPAIMRPVREPSRETAGESGNV
jgi:hypothetical protein